MIHIALVGQPNCGKSTIFNQVAGYKSITSNFPGKTITYNSTLITINGDVARLIDLPGTYSLASTDVTELETRNFIISKKADIVINVVDASVLIRSLELTLQLLELEIPFILCLNMLDEAKRKGMIIDDTRLSQILGIKVCKSIASKGFGIKELFKKSVAEAIKREYKPNIVPFNKDIEEVIKGLNGQIEPAIQDSLKLPRRFITLKLLENDKPFIGKVKEEAPELIKKARKYQKLLYESHGKTSDQVISSERHSLAMNIFEGVVEVKHGKIEVQ